MKSMTTAILALWVSTNFASAEVLKAGTQHESDFKQAEATHCPQPAITREMLEMGAQTQCLARFKIKASGRHEVELLDSTGSEECDESTLETLRSWRFKPASQEGHAVESVRKIKVVFEID